jgi:hypothetical protein
MTFSEKVRFLKQSIMQHLPCIDVVDDINALKQQFKDLSGIESHLIFTFDYDVGGISPLACLEQMEEIINIIKEASKTIGLLVLDEVFVHPRLTKKKWWSSDWHITWQYELCLGTGIDFI